MSRPSSSRRKNASSLPGLSKVLKNPLQSIPESRPATAARRNSISKGLNVALGPKTQRSSKVSQKLVVLPSEPQTRPLTDAAAPLDHTRSEGERLSKEERERHGFSRLVAYSVAEGFRAKALAAFLKREHGVSPRVFDEAIYAAYHFPLLPGYAPNVNVRSSAPPTHVSGSKEPLSTLTEVEEEGWGGAYFTKQRRPSFSNNVDGYISSSPPVSRALHATTPIATPSSEMEPDSALESETSPRSPARRLSDDELQEDAGDELDDDAATDRGGPTNGRAKYTSPPPIPRLSDNMGEVVVFDYGVVVFFGFQESQERQMLDDLLSDGLHLRPFPEDEWEIEQCHYIYDPTVLYPRIYNDFFTFKQPSHLLSLSLSHALAQSTLLAHYESSTQVVLSSPQTTAIPRQMATSGSLKLRRGEALRLTGRLFKLRRDVNLVSNVLDTPELFWSEATLKGLYDACREYFEINARAQVLNEKLSVASDLLDLIHDHLNTGSMDKITWIIIWLIVVACCVELGEVIARLVVHASSEAKLEQKCVALAAKKASLASSPGASPISLPFTTAVIMNTLNHVLQ